MKRALFFGYTLADGLYIAEPEKALLDQCYLATRGLLRLAWDEWDTSALDPTRVHAYASRFPRPVQARVQQAFAQALGGGPAHS